MRQAVANILKRARDAAPGALLTSGLLCPVALSAPGDFDTTFGDDGRVGPLVNFDGPSWAIAPLDGTFCGGDGGEDCVAFAGGDYECIGYGCDGDPFYDPLTFASGFVGRAFKTGSIDLSSELKLRDTQVLDVVAYPDGRIVGVGRTRRSPGDVAKLTVFRLNIDGSLDPTFGVGGLVHFESHELARPVGSSVVLDPDGRIVVAGVRNDLLIVLRLLANGVLDETFGNSGVYTGPANFHDVFPRIVRVADGGYRVTRNYLGDVPVQNVPNCTVLALTARGALDGSFGVQGVADLEVSSGFAVSCSSMAAQADGRLLVGGRLGRPEFATNGFAIRLLSSGNRDETFSTRGAVPAAMDEVTALDVSDSGSIVVAGRSEAGVPAALVMRLQANGALDEIFGNGGSTMIDLPAEHQAEPIIHDVAFQGGDIVIAGGDYATSPQRPFLAKLQGDDDDGGGDGPGVLDVVPTHVEVKEAAGEAVVTVRRTGGRAGRVSALVQTQPATSLPANERATAGQDYTATERTLTWEDGDGRDKQVVIPIVPDPDGAVAEEFEVFEVALSVVEGDAGLGTRIGTVVIAADGGPGGQFSIAAAQQNIPESAGSVTVTVSRNFYFDGVVSVSVAPVAGTAFGGADYSSDPLTLTWPDDDAGARTVHFTILDDQVEEDAEQFSVQLLAPTGGAIVGPRSTVSFTILDNDQSPPVSPPPLPPPTSGPPTSSNPPSSGSGGGGFGLFSLLLLGLGLLRRRS
jgi:uncharacterized delta-60 repeat protein